MDFEPVDLERYDSPEMLRHGDELHLVARCDVGGPYDQGSIGRLSESTLSFEPE